MKSLELKGRSIGIGGLPQDEHIFSSQTANFFGASNTWAKYNYTCKGDSLQNLREVLIRLFHEVMIHEVQVNFRIQ